MSPPVWSEWPLPPLRQRAVCGKLGRAAELADQVLVIDSTHYGRVEDAHMQICHMICYAFMEQPQIAG